MSKRTQSLASARLGRSVVRKTGFGGCGAVTRRRFGDAESTHRVTTAKLSQWRDDFLAGGEADLTHREVAVEDEALDG